MSLHSHKKFMKCLLAAATFYGKKGEAIPVTGHGGP
jgi:hypothetical protein